MSSLIARRGVSPLARRGGYWFYLLPGAILATAVIVVPLVWNLYLSFTYYRGVLPPRWIGLDNWAHLMRDSEFWMSFRNSVFCTGFELRDVENPAMAAPAPVASESV